MEHGTILQKNEKWEPTSVLTTVYLALIAFLFLLYTGFEGYAKITQHKTAIFLALSGLYIACVVIVQLELALVGKAKLKSPIVWLKELVLPQKFILLYWCFTGVSTALSVNKTVAFFGSDRQEGFLVISLYCWCFLLVSEYFHPTTALLWVWAGSVSLCCIVAILQLAGQNPLNLYPEGVNYYDANRLYSGEYLGTIGNADLLSAVLGLAIPTFWIALVRWRDRARFLLVIPLALSLFVLIRSRVAGGMVGVLGGFLITMPAIARKDDLRRKLAILSVLLFVGGLTAVYLAGNRLGGTIGELSQLMHGQWSDTYGSGRLYIWKETLSLVPERPLFGGGPDTLALRTTAAFERYDETLQLLIHNSVDVAHNEYLNILVNQGIFALAAYVGALIVTAKGWFREARKNDLAAITGGAALAYCIQAFFGISSPITSPFFWLILAILVKAIHPMGVKDKSKNAGGKSHEKAG